MHSRPVNANSQFQSADSIRVVENGLAGISADPLQVASQVPLSKGMRDRVCNANPNFGREAMAQGFLRFVYAHAKDVVFSQPIRGIGLGLLSGIYLLIAFQQHSLAWGTSFLASGTVLCLSGLAIGFAFLGNRRASRTVNPLVAVVGAPGLLQFVLAAWAVVMPWITGAIYSLLTTSATATWNQGQQAALFVIAALSVVPTVMCAVGIAKVWATPQGNSPPANDGENNIAFQSANAWAMYSIGIAIGLLIASTVLAPWLGLLNLTICAAAISCCLFVRSIRRQAALAPNDTPSDAIYSTSLNEDAVGAGGVGRAIPTILFGLMILGVGISFAATARMLHQLMPVSSWVIASEWFALFAGFGLGLLWSGRQWRQGKSVKARYCGAATILIVWPASIAVLYPALISASLWISANISIVSVVMAYRIILLCLALLPLAMAWAMLPNVYEALNRITYPLHSNREEPLARSQNENMLVAALIPVLFCVGIVTGHQLIVSIGNVSVIIAGLFSIQTLLLGLWWLSVPKPVGNRFARFCLAAVVILAFVAPWLSSGYVPQLAAKVLFSSQVFAASRNNVNSELLPVLDEGRLVELVEGDRATYSVWKYRGSQLQVRANGVPESLLSTNPELFPQFSGEVLQAALPLLLHEQPRNLLLLGAGGGVSLRTCLAFPILEATCVDDDPAALALLRQLNSGDSEQFVSDERVQLKQVSPVVAVAGHVQKYDVIISNPNQPALVCAGPHFTTEFYRRAARCLSAGGFFCQRFQFIDFGSQPLCQVARTMQAAFADVMAIEIAPGELLFVGTNSDAGFVRGNLIDRAQAEHVRKALGEVGWDWTVPLTLSAYNNSSLSEVVQEADVVANTLANSQMAFEWPVEVMRWAAKQEEIAKVFRPVSSKLLDWAQQDQVSDEVLQRFAELAGQQRLMADHPDEYWMYRKAVKEQIQERPRSTIQQVSGGGLRRRMHPDDKRRLAYFERLGAAAKMKHPSDAAIEAITAFEKPYDPLISYFLHCEVATLLARSEQREPARELAHRLHAIYFASPYDRSIRNVADAIHLLAEYPDAAPNAVERRDHLNALLQVLQNRWDLRRSYSPPSSRIVLNDIESSLAAMDAAFDTLQSLTAECDLPQELWSSRQRALEASLARPLRTYRSQILPLHHKNESRARRIRENLGNEAEVVDDQP